MKRIRELIFKDWRYKLIALLISVSLWSVVNVGSRTAISVSRYVEVRDGKAGYQYKVQPERVNITVYVVERLLFSRLIGYVKAYVDVSNIEDEGVYKLKVRTETKVPFLIHPATVDPPIVRIKVSK